MTPSAGILDISGFAYTGNNCYKDQRINYRSLFVCFLHIMKNSKCTVTTAVQEKYSLEHITEQLHQQRLNARKQSSKKKKIIKEEEVKNVEAFVFITIATLFISQEMHSLLKNTGNIKLEKHSLFPQQPSKH